MRPPKCACCNLRPAILRSVTDGRFYCGECEMALLPSIVAKTQLTREAYLYQQRMAARGA